MAPRIPAKSPASFADNEGLVLENTHGVDTNHRTRRGNRRALLAFAEKLTREPWSARQADLDTLRARGFSDEQLSEAVQVISYFNYINRMADGLGVDLEDFMPPKRG